MHPQRVMSINGRPLSSHASFVGLPRSGASKRIGTKLPSGWKLKLAACLTRYQHAVPRCSHLQTKEMVDHLLLRTIIPTERSQQRVNGPGISTSCFANLREFHSCATSAQCWNTLGRLQLQLRNGAVALHTIPCSFDFADSERKAIKTQALPSQSISASG